MKSGIIKQDLKVSDLRSTFEMDKVVQSLRFKKYALKYPDSKHSQIMIVTTCIEMSLKTLFKMIQARWYIETPYLTI